MQRFSRKTEQYPRTQRAKQRIRMMRIRWKMIEHLKSLAKLKKTPKVQMRRERREKWILPQQTTVC